MRQAAINISVFINYFSVSRVAFMKNKKAYSKTNYDIYILVLKLTQWLFFLLFLYSLFKGRKDLIIMYFSIIYDH